MRLTPLALTTAALLLALAAPAGAQTITISVQAAQNRVPVSPYLYGKNDSMGTPGSPTSAADVQRFREAGIRMLRMNAGNNATKYNWQKKLTSHPDWYNNVYASMDWDYAQAQLQQQLPGVQAMWAFQLLGKVADNAANNFNDWGYNQSQWWSGVGQNLAGGGTVNPAGGEHALQNGNPALYLTDTSAETSTAILDHWIKSTALGLDRRRFLYWNMDNEPEIWQGTHDDVMPSQISAEEFMQRYFAYAKRARARFPEIKLVGPVPANEWQWYNWPKAITSGGRSYPWLEYFIKRVAEEQAATGIRLLDVLDIHYYPGTKVPAEVVQLHRTFFDRTYVHPEANGVKAINGGWDSSINKEYIFGRCADWLEQYMGPKHGVTFGMTETAIAVTDAPLASVWYASTLGEFMRHGVEVFTPWSWQPGMWEVLHLFSRYNQTTSVRATSSDEATLSAYPTIDDRTGNLTIVLVNRALTGTRTASVTVADAAVRDGSYPTLQLANLPATETFVSHTTNHLQAGTVAVTGNQFSVTLPALSVTTVRLTQNAGEGPAPVASRLANLSVRARSGTGGDVLILGFFVGGSGTKSLLLRGVGPSLAPHGIAAPLADPLLTLASQSGGTVSTNDNWGTHAAQIAPVAASVGAFELSTSSLDAGLLADLPPGGYTATVAGKSGGVGIALGEAYDTDLGSTARLINISARTWVGTDADSLIAGFVVSGETGKTLLIRAVGPGLVPHGVGGVLADPILRVYRAGESMPIFQNDNWSATSYADEIAAKSAAAWAFPLPADSKDAVLLLTLPPGGYTAVVTGANGGTGVALVEVYELE